MAREGRGRATTIVDFLILPVYTRDLEVDSRFLWRCGSSWSIVSVAGTEDRAVVATHTGRPSCPR